MSNSVAEAYLLIVRESNVPIIGEAVPVPFTGQIELDSWSWDIKNERLQGTGRTTRRDEDKKEAKEKKEKAAKDERRQSPGTDTKVKTPSIQPEALDQ